MLLTALLCLLLLYPRTTCSKMAQIQWTGSSHINYCPTANLIEFSSVKIPSSQIYLGLCQVDKPTCAFRRFSYPRPCLPFVIRYYHQCPLPARPPWSHPSHRTLVSLVSLIHVQNLPWVPKCMPPTLRTVPGAQLGLAS